MSAPGVKAALSPDIRTGEILMMGPRLAEGVPRDRFFAITGYGLDRDIDRDGLGRRVEGRFLVADEAGLRATEAGRLCLNEVLRQLPALGQVFSGR